MNFDKKWPVNLKSVISVFILENDWELCTSQPTLKDAMKIAGWICINSNLVDVQIGNWNIANSTSAPDDGGNWVKIDGTDFVINLNFQ